MAQGSLCVLQLPRPPTAPVDCCALLCLFVGPLDLLASPSYGTDLQNRIYYPLIPSDTGTPVSVEGARSFSVPARGGAPGEVYRLVLDPNEDEREVDSLLHLFYSRNVSIRREYADTIDQVAFGIREAGSVVSEVVARTGAAVGWGIRQGGQHLKTHVVPAEQPSEVPGEAQIALREVRDVTSQAVEFSSSALSEATKTLGSAGAALGKWLGAQSGVVQHPANDKVKAIGGATAGAVLQVGASLLKTGSSLLNDAADVSSDLVGQRYGEKAGDATREGLRVVGNVVPLVQIPRLLVVGAMAETAGQMSGSVAADHAKSATALAPYFQTPAANTPSKSGMDLKMVLSESSSAQNALPRPSELAAAEGGGVERVMSEAAGAIEERMSEAACAIEERAAVMASRAAGYVRQQTHELATAAVEAVAPTSSVDSRDSNGQFL